MVVFVTTLFSVAWSQESTPTSRCADARPGDEIEVCLNEVAKHPEAVSAVASALRAHIDRGGTADRALLDALLLLMDPTTGVEGTERLAALADPRAVPPLVHTAEHREEPTASAAVMALTAFGSSLPHLTRWLRDEQQRRDIRLASARALGRLGTPEAADILVDTLRRPGIDADVRRTMAAIVQDDFPDRVGELNNQVSVNGAPWVTAGATWALGYSMTAAGTLGQADTALAPLGALTGSVAGGTAGYLYSRAWPVEAGNAAFISSSGFMGTLSGMLIGAGIESQDPVSTVYIGGLGGEILGYGLGLSLNPLYEGRAVDSWEAMGIGALTAAATGSAEAFRQQQMGASSSTVAPAAGAGLAVGTALGHLAAPRIDLTSRHLGLMGVSSLYGTSVGLLIPIQGGFRRGMPTLGFSAGALIGYGIGGVIEPETDVLTGAVTGGALGGVFGAGVAQLAAPADPLAIQGVALGGVTTGMIAGGILAEKNPDPIDDRDVVMTAMTTSWAAWQTAGWSEVAEKTSDVPGLLFVVPSVVGASNALLSGELDIPVTHSSAALSLGLWGAYAGSALGQISSVDPLAAALVGSDIALAGGVVVMSPAVGAPPLVIGLADAGGVLGGSTAALGAAIASDDPDTIFLASLIGAGVGLAGGTALGIHWHKSDTRRNIAWGLPTLPIPGRFSVSPAQLPGEDAPVLGIRIGLDQW